jgi:restriction system protein
MAEITRKRAGELLKGILGIVLEHSQGIRAKDALAELSHRVPPTEFELSRFPSGVVRFDKIARFSTIGAVKAGWMTKQKGQWSITEDGKKALQTFPDPETLFREADRLYREWKASQPDEDDENIIDDKGDVPGGKSARITFEEAEEQAWTEIEQYLRAMPWREFQELVASLLRAMDYHVAWVSPPGKDGGLDILAWSDPLGTKNPRIKVQVKQREETTNVGGLRSFMALLGDDDVGIFVSAGGFTKDAQEEARTQEKRKVTLIDLERLFDLWIEHYQELDEASRRRFPLTPIYFLAPGI